MIKVEVDAYQLYFFVFVAQVSRLVRFMAFESKLVNGSCAL